MCVIKVNKMNNLTGAQAACLPFARRAARCEHASQITQTWAKKNDIRSALCWNGQTSCLRSNQNTYFYWLCSNK
jgi:hypothetical protein